MCTLNDKVVIVTGGSSGIGRAAASSFAKQGAKVIITASRAGPHEEAAADHANLVRTWSARGSRASIKLGNCSMKSFISTITNGFTPLPEKSRFFAMKELLRRPVSEI
jgi:NAD(P)-dependent dehydrogenase (short-subunit alcohol dehydrogenase family)